MDASKSIQIGDRWVGASHPPFIIAEMSGNHNQSLEKALQIVEKAAEAGAHAIKLQTYTPDTMTLNIRDKEDFWIRESGSLWSGRHLYELYGEAYTPWDWHLTIMERAKQLGILCFSSPFDVSAVDFLESLDVPAFKIASFENNDVQLLRRLARTGKPIIASTGMSTLGDLHLLTETLKEAGCGMDNLVILKCTSAYPASPVDANLRTIPHMAAMFGCQVGLSDHTMGVGVPVAAVALGATVVEKHFCLSRAEGGVDSAFSLEPPELASLVTETHRAWQAIGNVSYALAKGEKDLKNIKRSLYVTEDLAAGTELSDGNLRSVRPGFGLEPKFWDVVLGKKLNTDVKAGTPLSWDLIG